MILGGDEMARTQQGNNNAYCQDNELSWLDWDGADSELRDFTESLIRLRLAEPALRPDWYRQAPEIGGPNVVRIVRADGAEFVDDDWEEPENKAITFVLAHTGSDAFALLLNAADNGVDFTLPAAPNHAWKLETTSDPQLKLGRKRSLTLGRTSFALLRSSMRTARRPDVQN